MLTKTIGQLSAATSIASADLIEIEQGGVSKYANMGMVATGLSCTTAESLLGSSESVLVTPAQVREATNSSNSSAPIYCCRAWVSFDGTTTSSSITATYTRASGSTTVVVTATGHGCISGNVQYLDFTTGTGSDNTYIVTVVDVNTFNVTGTGTAATSGAVTIKRSPILASGNVNNITYNITTTGTYYINFAASMPSAYYSISGMVQATDSGNILWVVDAVSPTAQSVKMATSNDAGAELNKITYVQVFA